MNKRKKKKTRKKKLQTYSITRLGVFLHTLFKKKNRNRQTLERRSVLRANVSKTESVISFGINHWRREGKKTDANKVCLQCRRLLWAPQFYYYIRRTE